MIKDIGIRQHNLANTMFTALADETTLRKVVPR